MARSHFSGPTLDDVMRHVIKAIRSRGVQIRPSKGEARELSGILLEITNPRARLSRTEVRGKLFSSLGEFCWYLAGSNELSFILYYLPGYKKYADGDIIYGGYGPRLSNWKNINQLENVTSILRMRPDSRKAVIQLFDGVDLVEKHNDVPCTCTLQFMLRDDRLHMLANMRSNDAFVGLPHDVFSFTMLQEVMARTLSVELGTYKHAVGSLHLYEINRDAAQRFLDEGWQSTKTPMPSMPIGDPWPAIHLLLEAEATLRVGGHIDTGKLDQIDPYWADLVRLLQVYRYRKERALGKMRDVGERIKSPVYKPFVERQVGELAELTKGHQ